MNTKELIDRIFKELQSITLTLGAYWEKRLSAAQKRFTRACETLARIRKLSRNAPALQVNIAADGGQQVNLGPHT